MTMTMESFHFFEILVPVADGKLFQPLCDVQIRTMINSAFTMSTLLKQFAYFQSPLHNTFTYIAYSLQFCSSFPFSILVCSN